MSQENQSFHYSYSAKEQEEIRKIRERYTKPQSESVDKMEQLRRLDAGVTKKATAAALVVGILSTIIMGTGMSLVMTDFGAVLGSLAVPVGIVVGLAGMIGAALADPVYQHTLKKEQSRIAPEILRLTDELMK